MPKSSYIETVFCTHFITIFQSTTCKKETVGTKDKTLQRKWNAEMCGKKERSEDDF